MVYFVLSRGDGLNNRVNDYLILGAKILIIGILQTAE